MKHVGRLPPSVLEFEVRTLNCAAFCNCYVGLYTSFRTILMYSHLFVVTFTAFAFGFCSDVMLVLVVLVVI